MEDATVCFCFVKWYNRGITMQKSTLVILFGSRARETASSQSDADVAVLADHPLTLSERSEFVLRIAQKIGAAEDRIDLVDLWHASPLLQRQIADEGRLLAGDAFDFLRFRVLAWKRYQDTAKFRRARERAIAQHVQ